MKETKHFQTESKELLSLMINSIYSNSEVFLRELISNASDAIDKYRFLSASDGNKYPYSSGEIDIAFDEKKKTITIEDNGVGMNKTDLENNLGTIAKSGSKEFMVNLKKAKDKADLNIIGQFGVGFYSAFIVADQVEVTSKKVGEEPAKFTSDGLEDYEIEDGVSFEKDHGSRIVLHLKKDTDDVKYSEFLSQYALERLIKKYSDYVIYPIKMEKTKSVQDLDQDGKPIENKYHDEKSIETINSMKPLWKKAPSEITEDDYKVFYKDKCGDYEDPLDHQLVSIEGLITYKAMLFIPSHAPYNYYSESYEKGLDLYAKGVFIQSKCKELIPDYLKFVRGVVDSEDFSLNISREMLQKSPVLSKVADSIEKKVIDNLKSMMKKDNEKYLKFWKEFGDNIKFGIYTTYGMKAEMLQDLLLFHSLKQDKLVSLKEYKDAMKKGQKSIYFASGKSIEAIKNLPQIEKYKANDTDVLLLDHDIDEFVLKMMSQYDKVVFKSIADDQEDSLSDDKKKEIEEKSASSKRLLDDLKEALKDKVSDVVISSKLVDSPVCLSSKNGLSLNMEKTLSEQAEMTHQETPKAEKVLEINPNHPIFAALTSIQEDDEAVKSYGALLYDEALMLEGYEVEDKIGFVKKLNELMLKGLAK